MPCYGLPGAFQHPEVVIGWYRMRAIRATDVRTAPGACGIVVKTASKGATLGRQSVRNPDSRPDPPRRDGVLIDGVMWVWCYTLSGSAQGWVNVADLREEIDFNVTALNGPGHYDFEVFRSLPRVKKNNGCGTLSPTRPIKTVRSVDTYLRYSGRGTAFHYLHRGDRVRVLISDAPAGFCFVEVVEVAPGSAAKVGSRGWLLHEALA
jgi:hypothetical protein